MQVIIFTDLDGSLLDYETYSFRESKPSLELIKKRQIPLIFATSKTRAEIEQLQIEMGIREPFIVENGAAVYFPNGYMEFDIYKGYKSSFYSVISIGSEYAEIRKFVEPIKKRFKIHGFGDLSEKEIASLASLNIEQANKAKAREYSEPFIMEDELVLPILENLAKSSGFKITRGGRFFHLIGKDQDKGRAVKIATEMFSENMNDKIISIGIGDSANDIQMLECVDIPVLIPHPDGKFEDFKIKNLLHAGQPGSKGWNQIVTDILNQIS